MSQEQRTIEVLLSTIRGVVKQHGNNVSVTDNKRSLREVLKMREAMTDVTRNETANA